METVCELTRAKLLAYRLLAPPIVGAGLFGLALVLFVDPFAHADLPPWLPSIVLWAICLAAYIALVFGLGRLVSAVPRRVAFDGKALRITRLFSGRSHRRMLSEVAALSVSAAGAVSLRFNDGSHCLLDGRTGPGLIPLSAAVPPSPAP